MTDQMPHQPLSNSSESSATTHPPLAPLATLRDVARYTPSVARLVGRCLRDKRVPLWRKGSLGALALYLAMPFDIVPDFIPVLGQADDLLLVVWVLRGFAHAVPPDVLADHWDAGIPLPQLLHEAQNVVRDLFKRGRKREHDETKPDQSE